MNFLNIFMHQDINKLVAAFRTIPNAVLLDVRSRQEYQEGHIPESKNLPLNQLDRISDITDNKNMPLFIYCYSGARSKQAVNILKRMGYINVTNIGGIAVYDGELEK